MISGPATEIEHSVKVLKEAGAKLVVPLKVSGAFHSWMMPSPLPGVFLIHRGIFHSPCLNFLLLLMLKPPPIRVLKKFLLFWLSKCIPLFYGQQRFKAFVLQA